MERVLDHIREAIVAISAARLESSAITVEHSLLELGMDSLRLVDLTVDLEERLALPEFPLQQWADQEALRDGPQFTVGSLAAAICALMASHAS